MHKTTASPRGDEAIRARCRHPGEPFTEFPREDVERSISDRFEALARRFPDRVAVRTRSETLTYEEECILVSTLGTSEFGDFAHYFVDRWGALPGGVVPAGYPAQDVEVLLLDEAVQPLADGVGEIAIRSRYGAMGYWKMPELTEAAFGRDAGDGRRIYRTGDLGRLAPDGCLFHLGRRDFQVKINGNRVHVSEVEAALLEDEAVRAAAVVGREEGSGTVRLVAYIVPAGPALPAASALRQTVAARLPSYMVPAVFVTLDACPRTATGKIDRRALPAPDGLRPTLDTAYLAARTPVEEALAAIWAEVLRVDRVGVHDSFYELGGDSLLATQVASRVLDRFALLLAPGSLLEAGTVAAMASVVLAGLATTADEQGLAAVLDALASPPEAAPRAAERSA